MCVIVGVFFISSVFDFRIKQQIHIWNLHDWLVLTVPITLKYSKKLTILEPFYGIRNILDSMCEIADVFSYISRTWLPIKTASTYLESARLTGSNSTKNIEILQKLTILEPFYGIRIILDICAKLSVFSHIFPVLDFGSKQYMHIWNLHDRLVLTVPITLQFSKNWLF